MRWLLWALMFVLMPSSAIPASACLCIGQPQTIADQIQHADATVIAEWIGPVSKNRRKAGGVAFEILITLKGTLPQCQSGVRIVVEGGHKGQDGDRFLIFGSATANGADYDWQFATTLTDDAMQYVRRLPPANCPIERRVRYYLRHVETADFSVATDAHLALSQFTFQQHRGCARWYSRQQLRQWISEPGQNPGRLGTFALMLAACGDRGDAEFLKSICANPSVETLLPLDEVMTAYLLLTGEEGFDWLEELLGNESEFFVKYAVLSAIRIYDDIGGKAVRRDRLSSAVTLLLGRPETADLAIDTLTMWREWSIQQRLLDMYFDARYQHPAVKRSIVRHLLHARADAPRGLLKPHWPAHASSADRELARLKKIDPQTVRAASLFFAAN